MPKRPDSLEPVKPQPTPVAPAASAPPARAAAAPRVAPAAPAPVASKPRSSSSKKNAWPTMPSAEDIQRRLDARSTPATTALPMPTATPVQVGEDRSGMTHMSSRSQGPGEFPAEEAARIEADLQESRDRGAAYQRATSDVQKWMSDDDFSKRVRGISYGTGLGARSSDASTYIRDRGVYLTNKAVDAAGGSAAVSPQQKDAFARDAQQQALRELGALKTVGLWSSTIVLPEEQKPQSEMTEEEKAVANRAPTVGDWVEGTVWGDNSKAAFKPRVEYLGNDKSGAPVFRQESPASYAMGLLSTGITPVVATGVPDYLAQKTFGKRPGAEEAELLAPWDAKFGKRAEGMLRERRLYSDVAQDTNPESTAGAVAVTLLGLTGDVRSPDPITGLALPVALKSGRKAMQLARLSEDVVGEAGRASRLVDEAATRGTAAFDAAERTALDALTDAAKEESAIKAAQRAGTATKEELAEGLRNAAASKSYARMQRLESAADTLADVERAASKNGPGLARVLNERTLAAAGDIIRRSPNRNRLEEVITRATSEQPLVAGSRAVVPRTPAELLDAVKFSIARDASGGGAVLTKKGMVGLDTRAMQDINVLDELVDVFREAHTDAATSLLADLRPSSGAQVNPFYKGGFGSYDALAQTLRDVEPVSVRAADKARDVADRAVRTGKLVLDEDQKAAFVQHVLDRTGVKVPDTLLPTGALTATDLARIDAHIAANLPREVDTAAALASRVRSPNLTERWGFDPKNVVVHGAQTILDRMSSATSMAGKGIKTLLTGADETKAWRDAGLNEHMRQASIEATRTVEAAVSDVAKLKSDEAVYAYLNSTTRTPRGHVAPVGGNVPSEALTSWELYQQAAHVGLVPESAVKQTARVLVPEGIVLSAEQERALDDLAERMTARAFSTPEAFMLELEREMNRMSLPIREKGGAHALGALAAAGGQTIPVWERWLGSGVVLSEHQHRALVDYWMGGVGEARGATRSGPAAIQRLRSLDDARFADTHAVTVDPTDAYTSQMLYKGPGSDLLQSLMSFNGTKLYVPTKLREKLADSLVAAAKAPETPDVMKWYLRLFARGVTRGTWVTNARHHLFNYYGDFEQIAVTHGWDVALRSQTETLLQQVMSVPVLGQVAQMAGKGRFQRGVLAAGEQLAPIITSLRKAAAEKSPVLDRLLWTAQTHADVNLILDGSDAVVRLGGKAYTYRDLRAAAVRGGVFDSFDVAELAEHIGAESPGTFSKVLEKNALSQSVQDVAEGISERRRLGLYRILLDHGATPDEAAKGVVSALYDYRNSLTQEERGMLRWFLPFWSWQKNANRQMLSAMLTPQGAYRIRALALGSEKMAEIAATTLSDEDDYHMLVGQMDSSAKDLYMKQLAYLRGIGMPDDKLSIFLSRDVLPPDWETWPAEAGGVSRPSMDDFNTLRSYAIRPLAALSVPSYYADRPMLPLRNKVPDPASPDFDRFYAYLLPPSASEAVFNWTGTLGGATLTMMRSIPGISDKSSSERNPAVVAQELLDVARSPVLGPVIASQTNVERPGPPTKLKSTTLGAFLSDMDAASPPSKEGGKYTIEGPWWQALYSTMPVQDVDRALGLAEAYMNAGQPDAARAILESTFGVPSADFVPRNQAGRDVQDVLPGLNKVERDRTFQQPQ